MTKSKYAYELHNFDGYEAYFLTVYVEIMFGGRKKRYVPAMATYINGRKNTHVRLRRFPSRINSRNFFYFIHAQDVAGLDEFVREHPAINIYLEKLKHYLKINK